MLAFPLQFPSPQTKQRNKEREFASLHTYPIHDFQQQLNAKLPMGYGIKIKWEIQS